MALSPLCAKDNGGRGISIIENRLCLEPAVIGYMEEGLMEMEEIKQKEGKKAGKERRKSFERPKLGRGEKG